MPAIPFDSHSGFYFPPGRPLWPSADDQMVQSERKPLRLPLRLKELRTLACFPVSHKEESTIPRQLLAGGEMTTSCHF